MQSVSECLTRPVLAAANLVARGGASCRPQARSGYMRSARGVSGWRDTLQAATDLCNLVAGANSACCTHTRRLHLLSAVQGSRGAAKVPMRLGLPPHPAVGLPAGARQHHHPAGRRRHVNLAIADEATMRYCGLWLRRPGAVLCRWLSSGTMLPHLPVAPPQKLRGYGSVFAVHGAHLRPVPATNGGSRGLGSTTRGPLGASAPVPAQPTQASRIPAQGRGRPAVHEPARLSRRGNSSHIAVRACRSLPCI